MKKKGFMVLKLKMTLFAIKDARLTAFRDRCVHDLRPKNVLKLEINQRQSRRILPLEIYSILML